MRVITAKIIIEKMFAPIPNMINGGVSRLNQNDQKGEA
ncbi:hypothetical protein Xentx_01025 [Xenorhabdus thuongxuanensis]|uniref:Uncharacterized protein n=1 Tax=Xenorhabdus thuongxuanensis TaxID=1873484 RepID=A0A1Q5U675_9GAMM|nr:hypothetical protein Xentx_01025 [Xenorhabdus thuongxuanensis]